MRNMNKLKNIKLTKNDMLEIQRILLELLCEMRRVCELAGIRYTIIAGTMLGAVRHGGFIPWDDDADVAMFRDEYEAFRRACDKHLDKSRFYFQDHTCTDGYRWGYGKLRRKDSRYVICGTEDLPYEQGIWIDIFPLDFIPNSWFGRIWCGIHCFLIRKLMYSESGKYREKNFIKRMLYAQMSKIHLETLLSHFDNYIRQRNRKRTGWVRILTFPTPNCEYGYRSKWYEDIEKIIFEGETFAGVRDYDEYLTFKFGNYMELPPWEQQKIHHHISELKIPELEEVEE